MLSTITTCILYFLHIVHGFCNLLPFIAKTERVGDTLTLECNCATGDGEFEVVWEKSYADNVVSTNELGRRSIEININASSGGLYRCSCSPCTQRCNICFNVEGKYLHVVYLLYSLLSPSYITVQTCPFIFSPMSLPPSHLLSSLLLPSLSPLSLPTSSFPI